MKIFVFPLKTTENTLNSFLESRKYIDLPREFIDWIEDCSAGDIYVACKLTSTDMQKLIGLCNERIDLCIRKGNFDDAVSSEDIDVYYADLFKNLKEAVDELNDICSEFDEFYLRTAEI